MLAIIALIQIDFRYLGDGIVLVGRLKVAQEPEECRKAVSIVRKIPSRNKNLTKLTAKKATIARPWHWYK